MYNFLLYDFRSSDGYCGLLTSEHGVFKGCHNVVEFHLFFEKCVFDVCATDGDRETLIEVNK